MNLLNEYYQPIKDTDPNIASSYFWEYRYSPKKENRGFFLTNKPVWNELTDGSYIVAIGQEKIRIPRGFCILIGDYDGGIDCLRVDEICGRAFEAFTFSNKLEPESWILRDMRVVGFDEKTVHLFPATKKPVAVHAGEGRAVMLSPVDIYNKISSYSFSDIV